MRPLPALILLCGGLAAVALLVPIASDGPSWLGYAWQSRRLNAVLLAVGAGVPVLVGAWGLLRSPLVRWHAIAATAGFTLIFLKLQLYRGLTRVLDAPLATQLVTVAVLLGLASSVVAMVVAPDRL